jgi:diguanylate cyclase (GGDEF)-like protein/PAS domain S-box-containing protein
MEDNPLSLAPEQGNLPELECLWAFIETIGEGITLSDQTGCFVVFNAKMEEITGYMKDEANAARDFARLIYPDKHDHEMALSRLGGLLRHGRLLDVETTITAKDGRKKTLIVSTTIVTQANRQLFFSTYRDITQRRQAEEDLRHERDFTDAVLHMMGGLVLVLDADGRVERVNRACENLLGYTLDEVKGRPYWDVFLPADEIDGARTYFQALSARRTTETHESYWLTRSGDRRLISWCSAIIVNADGQSEHVIGTGTDVTEHKQYELALQEANARLARLATVDSLTGLMNRRAFTERIAEECERAARHGTPLSLLMVDIDQFKAYNDTYGHPDGDMALSITGSVLRNTFRGSDFVARYGGEEFVVLLPYAELPDAISAAERLRTSLKAAPWPHRPLTLSIGISTFGHSAFTCDALMAEADSEMYRAKRGGGDRVLSATPLPAARCPALLEDPA